MDEHTCPACRRPDHKCVCDWPMPNPPAQLPAECPPGFRIPEKQEKP